MSLYIHEENQQLLWNIINKNPQIQQYFLSYPPNIKENWFKQIIISFYEQNRNILVSQEQLLDINKNTILYMINDVKRNIQYKEEQQNQRINKDQRIQQEYIQIQQNQNQNTDYLKSYSITENKQDKFTEQFNQYQNNYNSMFDKKAPESVDFREKIIEPQISNMEELMQKHLRERDEELKRYAPPPIFTPLSNEPKKDIQQNHSSNRIIIDKDSKNIKLSVEEFREPEINKSKINNDYTVKWLDNENSNDIKKLQKEVNDLKLIVLQLSNKIIEKEELKEPKLNKMIYKISEKQKLNQDTSSQYVGTIIGNILLDSEKFIPLQMKTNIRELNLDSTKMYDNDSLFNEESLYSMKNINQIKDIKNTRGYI